MAGERGPVAVGADVGDDVVALGRGLQRRAVVDERLPALLPVVDRVLASVLLQVAVPKRKRAIIWLRWSSGG